MEKIIEDQRLVGRTAEDLQLWRQTYETSGIEAFLRVFFEARKAEWKPYDAAASYALMGEDDLAFEWLDRAYEFPMLPPFFTDARFDSLRDDPRYEQLLRELNLPEEAIERHLAVR